MSVEKGERSLQWASPCFCRRGRQKWRGWSWGEGSCLSKTLGTQPSRVGCKEQCAVGENMFVFVHELLRISLRKAHSAVSQHSKWVQTARRATLRFFLGLTPDVDLSQWFSSSVSQHIDVSQTVHRCPQEFTGGSFISRAKEPHVINFQYLGLQCLRSIRILK